MRRSWTFGAAVLLVACAACASATDPGDGNGTAEPSTRLAPTSDGGGAAASSDGGGGATHNPDALTGVDHLVALCNSGAPAPPATREIVEAWASEDPKYVCNDEKGTGTYVVSGGADVDVPEDGITALTPGEPFPEDYRLVDEDASLLLIVGGDLYTARFALRYSYS